MIVKQTDELASQIAAIETLNRTECLDRWREVFGRSTPKHLSPRFMKRALIWALQTQKLGGVSKKTERTLRQVAEGRAPPAPARSGSHLVREWNGRTYQVEVTGDGYLLDDKIHRSLSAVARHITGAHWSGPRFFGTS